MALLLGIVGGLALSVWPESTRRPGPTRPRWSVNRRTLGWLLPIALLAITGSLPLGVSSAASLLLAEPARHALAQRRFARSIEQAWPATLEVIATGVGAGMTIDEILRFTARCAPTAVVPKFDGASRMLEAGSSRRDALRSLLGTNAEAIGPVVDVLLAAERDGAPSSLVLDRIASLSDRSHRLAAQERARRVPVLMLAPLTLCSLPAVLVGTAVPFVLLTFGQTSL